MSAAKGRGYLVTGIAAVVVIGAIAYYLTTHRAEKPETELAAAPSASPPATAAPAASQPTAAPAVKKSDQLGTAEEQMVRLPIALKTRLKKENYGWRFEDFSHGFNGFIDGAGNVVAEPKWDDAVFPGEGQDLVPVKRENKWGFIDRAGNIVIEPQWDDAQGFSQEGLAGVKRDNKWGFIDRAGKIVIEPQWEEIWGGGFSEGLAIVRRAQKFGAIDRTGKIVIEPQWEEYFGFSDGLA